MRSLGLTAVELQVRKKVKAREWYARNREISIARAKGRQENSAKWARNNRERVRATVNKWRKYTQAGRDYASYGVFLRRLSNHNLTLDQYHSRVESQNFCCAVCGEVPKVTRNRNGDGFHIDHHHASGKVRGLLCGHCNVGIGMLKDSPKVCNQAASYLITRTPRLDTTPTLPHSRITFSSS